MPVAEAVEDVDQLLDAVSTDVVCMLFGGCRRHMDNGGRVRIKPGRNRVLSVKPGVRDSQLCS